MGILASLSKFWSSLFKQPASVPKLGRNQLCYCGSGKKYKNCHLQEDQEKELLTLSRQHFAQLNREQEPQWLNSILDPAEVIAQRQAEKIPEYSKKKKSSKD